MMKNECFFPKIGKKTKISDLLTFIQHYSRGSRQCSEKKKEKEGRIEEERGKGKIFNTLNYMQKLT